MRKTKNRMLSNPFSTGGGGFHFETHVQALFVVLMLTGGHAPCLPCWPIVEIKLQGKINGFETDDLIVFVEDPKSRERRKILGQVKHSIYITRGSALFGDVIQAAWNDFNNPKLFTKNKDAIALMTGPLSAADAHTVPWLLDQARRTKSIDEFFRNVEQANFSPSRSSEKLDIIQHHLKIANGGNEVSRKELYDFLKHFYLLSYDLGKEYGVVMSLLHSHISQLLQQNQQLLWSRVVDIVQTWNQDAGTITIETIPEDIRDALKQKSIALMPEEFKTEQEKPKTDWTQHPDASYLALAILVGAWQDKNQNDHKALAQLLGINYDEWLKKAREILHSPDSPLSLKNGIWQVLNRVELWNLLGSRIIDHDLDTFRSMAVSVLKESDPAFELPAEERYLAGIHGNALKYSHMLRRGIAEGLAILGSQPKTCCNCSQGKVEETSVSVIHELLADADWILWGSLNDLLPTLAEAAPDEFLDSVEQALSRRPCPFDELYAQEDSGIFGRNYLTGLLWALEGLAWDEQYLVRVCVTLAELASHDPGGQCANRPFNSLVTILLPWFPQTLGSIEKRKAAVQTMLRECPDVAWDLIIKLLPGQQQTSSETYKPRWRMKIPDNWKKGVTSQEYWQQISFYAELALTEAGQDIARLSALVDNLDNLPDPAFDKLLQTLGSENIVGIPEERRVPLWDHLRKFINKHRRFSDAKWALPEEMIIRIEQITQKLAPTNPFNLYQHLFTGNDVDLYEEKGDWQLQQKKLYERREKAIFEIFQQNGIDGVIRFAESVSSPDKVGHALGVIDDAAIEQTLLPRFLDSTDNKRRALVSGFIWRRYHLKGWKWCDNIDKTEWTPEQIGHFLAYLPFNKGAWDRASKWLSKKENEYWTRTSANPCDADDDLPIAIEKLIQHGRPHAAINCLGKMRNDQQPIECNQCVRALFAALSSKESSYTINSYQIIELIKFLQTEPSVNQDDLIRLEWAYLPLLDRRSGASPKLLESKLANDPKFFCEVIRLIYRSKKENRPSREPTEELRSIAENAWLLLHEWKTPPGTQKDGTFSEDCFNNWLCKVKEICTETGHIEVALIHVGQVLIHAPADPGGLWINRAVATALNDRSADQLRDGFSMGMYNSRGVHWVDPTGKPERELAEQLRRKAEEIENAGFQRFAATLRNLADSYDREAERIISKHQQE